jgi:hypothetical protein
MSGRNKQDKKSETLVDENDYPILEGLENLLSEIKSQKGLAESLWEGCDGCTDQDKHFWIKGFIQGLNYRGKNKIQDKSETKRNRAI